jgi:hypothetical protein
LDSEVVQTVPDGLELELRSRTHGTSVGSPLRLP